MASGRGLGLDQQLAGLRGVHQRRFEGALHRIVLGVDALRQVLELARLTAELVPPGSGLAAKDVQLPAYA